MGGLCYGGHMDTLQGYYILGRMDKLSLSCNQDFSQQPLPPTVAYQGLKGCGSLVSLIFTAHPYGALIKQPLPVAANI